MSDAHVVGARIEVQIGRVEGEGRPQIFFARCKAEPTFLPAASVVSIRDGRT